MMDPSTAHAEARMRLLPCVSLPHAQPLEEPLSCLGKNTAPLQ